MKCNYCESKVKKRVYQYESSKNNKDGKKIIIADAEFYSCPYCDHEWMSEDQEKDLSEKIKKAES